ncbi:MAG: dipeptidase PepV [Cloacibacillus sp.]
MGRINNSIRQSIEENFKNQVIDTQDLIKIKSVLQEERANTEHPFGANLTAALEKFLDNAKQMGFKTENKDNYVGWAEMGDKEARLIGILAHLDVVPEGNQSDWKHPPYDAVIENNNLYGRGSIDDKGPAIAALYAMKAIRDSGIPLRNRFRLILGLDEESGSRCIAHYNATAEKPAFCFSPDASFPVVNAEKGILRFTVELPLKAQCSEAGTTIVSIKGGDRFNVVPDKAEAVLRCAPLTAGLENRNVTITTNGVSAHAMEPEKGLNAIQLLLDRLAQLESSDGIREMIAAISAVAGDGHGGEQFGIAIKDEISGALTCNTAAIEADFSTECPVVTVKFDIRYPVTANFENILDNITTTIKAAGAKMAVNVHKKPLYIPESHPVVQAILDSYESVMNARPAPISMGGGTYCRFMPDSVSAGPLFPGQEELAHQPNEFVSLDDLLKSTLIYAEIIMRLNDIE